MKLTFEFYLRRKIALLIRMELEISKQTVRPRTGGGSDSKAANLYRNYQLRFIGK